MSRNCTERPKYKKYDYKTHHATFTQRSESLNRTDPLSSSRKTSAFKNRKDSTENSILHQEPNPFEDIRLPLGEIFQNSTKVARALIDPKKDGRNLRNRNAELQLKIARQAKEMEEMRLTLNEMKSKENQELKQVNLSLQARCEAQDKEMASLRTQVNNLMALVQGETFSCQNGGQLQESHISRRAEYRQNYEDIASFIPKPLCSQCMTINQEIQQLHIRYETQLLRSKNDHQTMLTQQEKIAQLELQLQHKNKCIDYLRQQIEEYERSSKQQINTGFLLNSKKKVRHQGRDIYVRSKPDESFNSFSDFRY